MADIQKTKKLVKRGLTIGSVFGILTKLSGGVEARPGAAEKSS
jgi:hypothetical protein